MHELMEYYKTNRALIGFDPRVTRLGHVVRGGTPTAADRVLATRPARPSTRSPPARMALAGIVRNDIVTTPLADITGRTRPGWTRACSSSRA